MTHNDRDQELLKQYMDHLLPEDDGNLEIIKQRLDKEAFRRRRKAALRKRANRLYGLSVACILLCAAVVAGSQWLETRYIQVSHAGSVELPQYDLFETIIRATPVIRDAAFFIPILLVIAAAVCLWRGIVNQKKSDKL